MVAVIRVTTKQLVLGGALLVVASLPIYQYHCAHHLQPHHHQLRHKSNHGLNYVHHAPSFAAIQDAALPTQAPHLLDEPAEVSLDTNISAVATSWDESATESRASASDEEQEHEMVLPVLVQEPPPSQSSEEPASPPADRTSHAQRSTQLPTRGLDCSSLRAFLESRERRPLTPLVQYAAGSSGVNGTWAYRNGAA
eukprot:CAMPEP_0114262066 /NCGR_PEP_ID=MMETSP0058-20121206/21549_1 /TAXON_ID=36894 /ORGANISM="Pyramimonas parkeae, CCMP726" /LENGTH=195 /DNA_ID=CAMNT_0001377797 /DNA_START=76 /DNA_END=660 /DNA_ORIENTATION=-